MKNLIAMSFKKYFNKIEQIENKYYEGTSNPRDAIFIFSIIAASFIFALTSLFLLCAVFLNNVLFIIPLIFTIGLTCLFGGTATYLSEIFLI